MKTIYSIIIFNGLILFHTFGQDSLKNRISTEDIIIINGKHELEKLTQELKQVETRVITFRNKASRNRENWTVEIPTPPTPPTPPTNFSFSIDETQENAQDNPIEKKKVISKSFTVDAKDRLTINNQHGDVKVELWNKNEIKVDVTIIGYGTSEEKAQALIDNVSIYSASVNKGNGENISFQTNISSDDNGNWGNAWSWMGSKKKAEECNCPNGKKGVEINYMIYMPRTNALSVSNKYGKTIIPQFDAPLRVSSNYGSFTCDRLKGADKDIFVQYGSGDIKQMDDGNLQISYSKLNVDKADNLFLKNNYGSVTLDNINNLDGTFQYSSGKIGKINETGKLAISYSDGVQLSELSKTLKSLDIRSNYTAVKLPVNGDCNADFEVTTTYANFRYPTGKVSFTVNPDENNDEDRKMGWQPTKVYKGKIGKGSNTKITIRTNYAGVKFMEK